MTSCIKEAESESSVSFTFCQNSQCCSIGGIPAQTQNCHINKYGINEVTKHGNCTKFGIGSKMQGSVTFSELSATDGWRGEWVRLFFRDIAFHCKINDFIDSDGNGGDGVNHPRSSDFHCNIQGRFKKVHTSDKQKIK